MTKAYLAGFIAGTLNKSHYDCPYWEEGGYNYGQWILGLTDGDAIRRGCNYTGREVVPCTTN